MFILDLRVVVSFHILFFDLSRILKISLNCSLLYLVSSAFLIFLSLVNGTFCFAIPYSLSCSAIVMSSKCLTTKIERLNLDITED